MSYDEKLASRVRRLLSSHDQVSERKMFGGLCFMAGGSMCCGVLGRDLIVRIGPQRYAEALARPYVRAFDFTGRPSRGMVYVGPDSIRTAAALRSWVKEGLSFAATSAPPTERRRQRTVRAIEKGQRARR